MDNNGRATISIPKALFDRVSKLINDRPELGFTSPSDFIRDAIREKLEREEGKKKAN